MDCKLDSWVAARDLIDRFGESAAYDHARKRARMMKGNGAPHAAAVWRLVERAVLDLSHGPAREQADRA